MAIVDHTKTENDRAHDEDASRTSVNHHMVIGARGVVVSGLDVGMTRKLAMLVDRVPDTLGHSADCWEAGRLEVALVVVPGAEDIAACIGGNTIGYNAARGAAFEEGAANSLAGSRGCDDLAHEHELGGTASKGVSESKGYIGGECVEANNRTSSERSRV